MRHTQLPISVLSATSLTSDITSEQQLQALINPKAHYQAIPASPQTTSRLTHIIPTLLKQSKGKIIDVCLPYQRSCKSVHDQHYLGRYVFIDGKLVAIRLASSNTNKYGNYPHSHLLKWPKNLVEEASLPGEFVKYRPAETSRNGKIFIGDFIIELKNAILGLLFLSEMKQHPRIVDEYMKSGVTILSIMDDTPHPHSAGQINNITCKAPNQSIINLKPTHLHKHMLMYSGMRYATLESVYMSIGVIASEERIQLGSSLIVNDTCLSVVCDLPKKKEEKDSSIDLDGTPTININMEFPTSRENFPQKVTKDQVGLKLPQLNAIPRKFDNLIPVLKLLYLFKHVNKGKPFILPSSIGTNLIIELNKLKTLLDKNIEDIFQIYKYKDNNDEIGNWISKVKIHESLESLIISKKNEPVFVYTVGEKEFSYFEILSSKYQNIRICSQLLSKVTGANHISHRNQQVHKMTNFVDEVLETPVYDLSQILKIARSEKFKLSQEQIIEAVTLRVKQKYRQCFNLSPLANYFIENEPSTIKRDLIDAELRLAYNQGGIKVYRQSSSKKPKPVAQEKTPEKKGSHEDTFEKKLQAAKKMKKRQISRKHIKCHSCQVHMDSSFTYHCRQCQIDACLPCIEQLGKVTEKDHGAYQKCIVCLKLCRCRDCKKQLQSEYKDLFEPLLAEQQQVTIYQPAGHSEDGCSRCLVIGRPLNNIKVMCQKCQASQCYFCLKEAKKMKNHYKWTCKQCREENETMQEEGNAEVNKIEVEKNNAEEGQVIESTQKITPPEIPPVVPSIPGPQPNDHWPYRMPVPQFWVNRGIYQLPRNVQPPQPNRRVPLHTNLEKQRSSKRHKSSSSSYSSSSGLSSYKRRKDKKRVQHKKHNSAKSNQKIVYVSAKYVSPKKCKRSSSSSSVSSSSSSSSSSSRSRSRQGKRKDLILKDPRKRSSFHHKESLVPQINTKSISARQTELLNKPSKPLWGSFSQIRQEKIHEKRKSETEPIKKPNDNCIIPTDRYISKQDYDY